MAAASAADDASSGPSPSLAALDPSLGDDYRPVFDREVPIERRLQTDESVEEIGTLEALRVKVLVQGDEAAPTAVKMELTRCVSKRVCKIAVSWDAMLPLLTTAGIA